MENGPETEVELEDCAFEDEYPARLEAEKQRTLEKITWGY